MNKLLTCPPVSDLDAANRLWSEQYAAQIDKDREIENRSGIPVKPLYTPSDWNGANYMEALGFPGQLPYTRGVYSTMHRGRSWTQRQLVGLGTPEDYNLRLREILEAGASAISLIPCNSVFRGYDVDEVDPVLLGTCGTTINTVEDMAVCLEGVDIGKTSIALNDPSPFTLLAFLLVVAKRRGVPWEKITGTSNQSDYLSHFAALHMFFRIALPGSQRILTDHVEFMNRHVPGWNPISVVGQHMQQAGATPAQTMGLTLSSAIQHAQDFMARGMSPDAFLPRLSFFFDISISFFEEIAKFRAGRRLWSKIAKERLGAKDPRSWRFKFHSQTSGVDLTRQQPLNNISRVAVQAMAGILGGLQSLHTDGHDEALSSPTPEAARISVSTQNILREEAGLCDVIDPLGGSYYVERLTDQMQEEIEQVIAQVDAAGGMYAAVESGLVQKMIGESAMAFQLKVEKGEQKIVGVNCYQVEEEAPLKTQERPAQDRILAQIEKLKAFKAGRNQQAVKEALAKLAAAAHDPKDNVFARVVEAAEAGATHGELCRTLRTEMGFGQPLAIV